MSCDNGFEYRPCGTPCLNTCQNPSAASTCGLRCKEGCYCPTGKLNNNGSCINQSDCQCLDANNYFHHASMPFYFSNKKISNYMNNRLETNGLRSLVMQFWNAMLIRRFQQPRSPHAPSTVFVEWMELPCNAYAIQIMKALAVRWFFTFGNCYILHPKPTCSMFKRVYYI